MSCFILFGAQFTVGANRLLQVVMSTFGPDEWFRAGVVVRDILVDSRAQFGHAGEYTPVRLVLGKVAEEPLNHVQPFRMAVSFLTLGNDFTTERVEQVERRKRGRGVALVVVRMAVARPFHKGKPGCV